MRRGHFFFLPTSFLNILILNPTQPQWLLRRMTCSSSSCRGRDGAMQIQCSQDWVPEGYPELENLGNASRRFAGIEVADG